MELDDFQMNVIYVVAALSLALLIVIGYIIYIICAVIAVYYFALPCTRNGRIDIIQILLAIFFPFLFILTSAKHISKISLFNLKLYKSKNKFK